VVLDAPRRASAANCMPPALLSQLDAAGEVTGEPYTHLAADPRPGADAPAGARAKVVAGLLGVDPQDILPRIEAQVRLENRRLAALIGAIAALTLVLGLGGWGLERQLHSMQDAADAHHAEEMAGQQKLKRLYLDAAGGGAPAISTIQAFRELLRPYHPEIDTIPPEQMPVLMKSVLDTVSKPHADAQPVPEPSARL
jgi:hypothetical protein